MMDPMELKANDLIAILMALLDRLPDGAINIPAEELARNGRDRRRVVATQIIELPQATFVRVSVQDKVQAATQRSRKPS